MTDVSLSPGAVLAVGSLLASLCGAIGALFWALIASKNAAIEREQQLTNKLMPAVEDNTRTLTRLAELIQEMIAEYRREQERERNMPRGRSV